MYGVGGRPVGKRDFLKKWTLRLSVVFLPLSIGFIAVSVTLMTLMDYRPPRFLLPLASVLSGILLWFAGVQVEKRARFFFAATFLLLTGGMFILLDAGLLSIPFPAIWPFLMPFIGISFIVSGYLRYRRVHVVYMAPAVAFSGLGFLFLLFATDVITVSIGSIVLWWFPVLLLPSIISMVIWLVQRKRKNGVLNG